MPRRIAAVLLAGATLAGVAHAAPQRDTLVRPGVSIGDVRLGMTLRQVRRVLGGPGYPIESRHLGFGREYRELGWGIGTWRIGFEGRTGDLRAVRIAASLARERTPQGIGTGSLVRDIVRAYPSATCVYRWRSEPWDGQWVVVAGPRGRMTAFRIIGHPRFYTRPGRVGEILVQARWPSTSNLDEDCQPGWEQG